MPLETELPIAETSSFTNWYAVSFFDATLKHHDDDGHLADSDASAANPLVHSVANCEQVQARPFDLHSGDKITFSPAGTSATGDASLRGGATLFRYDAARRGGGESVALSYPGFSSPCRALRIRSALSS